MLLDILFPRFCLGCGKYGGYICAKCRGKIKLTQDKCPVCDKLSFQGKTHAICKKKNSLDGLFSIYKYEGAVKNLIRAIKYKFAFDVASTIAKFVVDGVREERFSFDNAVLVPVPLHPQRERWRGFNQAELIGKIVARQLGWKFENRLIYKLKNTTPQMNLDREKRLRNLCGKFAVNRAYKNKIEPGKTYIIFDDVATTGATIAEICKVLKGSGAKKVWGLTIAR